MSKFDTHGGYFAPKDYLKVNEGGSHEENPNGGVQIGVDPEGTPNLLEEGEPVYQDYVYSDNIVAEREFLEQNNLPGKYDGKLYSKIADDILSEAEERPMDPISHNGLDAMLGRLAEAQEAQKQRDQQRELENELSQLSPEELDELEAMLAQQEQMPQEQMQPEPMMQQSVEQVPMMRCGGKMRKFAVGGDTTAPEPDWDPSGLYALNPTFPWALLPSIRDRIKQSQIPFEQQELVPVDENGLVQNLDPVTVTAQGRWVSPITLPGVEGPRESMTIVPLQKTPKEKHFEYPTVSRYSGAIGNALLGLYDVFQQPDKYSLRRYTPTLPSGRIHLQNQVYNPIDQNMVANQIAAQGNATTRALRNSGLGTGTVAAILSADNNTTGNLGTGFLQTWDANNQRKNAVLAANNQTEAQRAQFDYTVDQQRAAALNDAAIRNAQNDLMLQRLNYDAESEKYQAISNQIDKSLAALADIGRENFAANQVNSNPALGGYMVDKNGRTVYVPNSFMPIAINSSLGGFLKKIKK